MADLRDHGFRDSPQTTGPPTIRQTQPMDEHCPACQGKTVFPIAVPIEPPQLLRVPTGYTPVGTYLGCAACPWASPMWTTAVPQ